MNLIDMSYIISLIIIVNLIDLGCVFNLIIRMNLVYIIGLMIVIVCISDLVFIISLFDL